MYMAYELLEDKHVMLIFHKNWLRNDLDIMIYKIDSHDYFFFICLHLFNLLLEYPYQLIIDVRCHFFSDGKEKLPQ